MHLGLEQELSYDDHSHDDWKYIGSFADRRLLLALVKVFQKNLQTGALQNETLCFNFPQLDQSPSNMIKNITVNIIDPVVRQKQNIIDLILYAS